MGFSIGDWRLAIEGGAALDFGFWIFDFGFSIEDSSIFDLRFSILKFRFFILDFRVSIFDRRDEPLVAILEQTHKIGAVRAHHHRHPANLDAQLMDRRR